MRIVVKVRYKPFFTSTHGALLTEPAQRPGSDRGRRAGRPAALHRPAPGPAARRAGRVRGGADPACHRPSRCLVLTCDRIDKPAAKEHVMRVLVAGATGAVGRQLVPQLVSAGHQVTATTRSPGEAGRPAGGWRRPADSRRAGRAGCRRSRGQGEARGHRARDDGDPGEAESPQVRAGFRRHQRSCGPAGWTSCWPPLRRMVSGASSRRVTPAGRTSARADRSRPRTIRLTLSRLPRCEPPWTRSGTWNRP